VVKAFKPAADTWSDNVIIFGRLILRPDVNRAYWDDMDVGLTGGNTTSSICWRRTLAAT
jgi:hypothetical protein